MQVLRLSPHECIQEQVTERFQGFVQCATRAPMRIKEQTVDAPVPHVSPSRSALHWRGMTLLGVRGGCQVLDLRCTFCFLMCLTSAASRIRDQPIKIRLQVTSAWPTTTCSSTGPEQRLKSTRKTPEGDRQSGCLSPSVHCAFTSRGESLLRVPQDTCTKCPNARNKRSHSRFASTCGRGLSPSCSIFRAPQRVWQGSPLDSPRGLPRGPTFPGTLFSSSAHCLDRRHQFLRLLLLSTAKAP